MDGGARSADGHRLEGTANLAAVRAELAEVEALVDEVRQRAAHLRALLPSDQFRLVWALLDAQERLGLAEQVLAELVAAVRATARQLSDDVARPGDVR